MGENEASRMRRFTSSMPLFDAASCSTTSGELPASILKQLAHVLHGSNELPFPANTLSKQLTDFATMRAVDVFPIPLEPMKSSA